MTTKSKKKKTSIQKIKKKYNDFKTKYHFFAYAMDNFPGMMISLFVFVFLVLVFAVVFVLKVSFSEGNFQINESPIKYEKKK